MKKELHDKIEKNYLETSIDNEMIAFLPHMDKRFLDDIQRLPSHYHIRDIGRPCHSLVISYKLCQLQCCKSVLLDIYYTAQD